MKTELCISVCVCLQAHLVAAFEKSLSNMTCRLQSLTMTAEQKVQELNPEPGIHCRWTSWQRDYRREKWLNTGQPLDAGIVESNNGEAAGLIGIFFYL